MSKAKAVTAKSALHTQTHNGAALDSAIAKKEHDDFPSISLLQNSVEPTNDRPTVRHVLRGCMVCKCLGLRERTDVRPLSLDRRPTPLPSS